MNARKKQDLNSDREAPILFWVISGKNAYQTFLMLLILISSIPLMLGVVNASNPSSALPLWTNQAWGACLFLGALGNLAGVYWRGRLLTGLRFELSSSGLLGLVSILYGILLSIQIGRSALLSVVIIFLMAVGAGGRIWQIIAAYRQVLFFKKEISSQRPAELR